jgi:hypothetical protein
VIVEIRYIWWEGPEKALSGHLVEPYEVKERLEDAEMIENEREDEVELLSHGQTWASSTIGSIRKLLLATDTRRNNTASE